MSNQDAFEDETPSTSRSSSARSGSGSRSGNTSRSGGAPRSRDDSLTSSISQVGDRLLEAARRNPEALVILAAGAAMLLRRGNLYGGETAVDRSGRNRRDGSRADNDGERGRIVEAAGAAGEYVTDAAGRMVDTAGEYVSTLSDYADESRRTATRGISRLSRRASRMGSRAQATAERMLQGQPVNVAAFGLATGAVVAALLPRSEVEQRTLIPAREALADAASRGVEMVKETAERRLSSDGLRELAGEAAKIVTQTVLGKAGDRDRDDDRA